MILFASTYEEAVCSASTCNLTFLDSDQLPTVDLATPSYNSATGKHIITVAGYNIADTSTATVQAFIGGIEQTVLSVTSTSVVIQIDNVTTMNA